MQLSNPRVGLSVTDGNNYQMQITDSNDATLTRALLVF